MAMTHANYQGKHVKHSHSGLDSRTPRGPERWARAAHNALVNPLSKGAKLYVARLTTAHRFRSVEDGALPFEHVEQRYSPGYNTVVSSKRRYVTCNVVCAAMQAQLDFGTTEFHEVVAILAGNYRRTHSWRGEVRYSTWQTNVYPLVSSNLKRDVRCQVCGTTVKKGA